MRLPNGASESLWLELCLWPWRTNIDPSISSFLCNRMQVKPKMRQDFRLASVLLVPFLFGGKISQKWEYVFQLVAQPMGQMSKVKQCTEMAVSSWSNHHPFLLRCPLRLAWGNIWKEQLTYLNLFAKSILLHPVIPSSPALHEGDLDRDSLWQILDYQKPLAAAFQCLREEVG